MSSVVSKGSISGTVSNKGSIEAEASSSASVKSGVIGIQGPPGPMGPQGPKGEYADPVEWEDIANRPSIEAGSGENSVIIGGQTHNSADGVCSVAEGSYTTAVYMASHAEGMGSTSGAQAAHAEGYYTQANSLYSHSEGNRSKASGTAAHSEGSKTIASGSAAHSEGFSTLASGTAAHSEGGSLNENGGAISKQTVDGDEILSTTAAGIESHAEGMMTYAKGASSHSEGMMTYAKGSGSHSEGYSSQATGNYSHAEGYNVNASGQMSHAEGFQTTASTTGSHTEGYKTTASGNYSHAEGSQSIASGNYSHAEGVGSSSTGVGAHCEGEHATASGTISHAEGASTTASGTASHAEGGSTTASGMASHAEGIATVANHKTQHVFGDYNVPDPSSAASSARGTYVEIVGNGTADNARSNARTLDWDGNEILAGKLTVGAGPANDMDAATKKYVDDAVDGVDVPVEDVQIDGTSIVNDGVAEIPIAGTEFGVVKVRGLGVVIDNGSYGDVGELRLSPASNNQIKRGVGTTAPITATTQHQATFYGLTKAAGVDMSSSSNPVGTYTDEAKAAIQTMLGIDDAIADAISDITSFDFAVVQELPQSGEKGVIYLVAHSHDTDDGFDEYIWITDRFEKLGHCDVDLTDYVTFNDIAGANTAGVVKVRPAYGIRILSGGYLAPAQASDEMIKAGVTGFNPIVPSNQHTAAFYGLAKAAGDTSQPASENAVGTYTEEAKVAIKTMIGVEEPEIPVEDVQINGTSVVSNGVAEIPQASSGELGLVRVLPKFGFNSVIDEDNKRYNVIMLAGSQTVKEGQHRYQPITPYNQHRAAFYGLAKAAGDVTQSASDNAVGTYTDEAKAAIKSMIGVEEPEIPVEDVQIDGTSIVNNGVANIPIAGETPGVVGIVAGRGLSMTSANNLTILPAPSIYIKAGENQYTPIAPYRQHESTFYGLAKAAGDSTQAQSSNAVGTYTDEAKDAIRIMLGISDPTRSITVSGTDPVIVATAYTRYVCGEVLSLDFTPSQTGICDVIFTAGSTLPVLTLPQTVKMPEWFEIETDHTYEISILDGVYGAVMIW